LFDAKFNPADPPEYVRCFKMMKLGREYLLSTQQLDIYGLLCVLSQNVGKVLTHKFIAEKIWGRAWETDVGSLRVFMTTLRKKIEKLPDSPQYIQTHIGVGYRMMKVE
ncbi:MAG: winged helix-turn-helix domain-containing protein, partial [Clostridia bacterium]|nr:winged helix-turn-helix domain-containing protein [Clostridia bacterium]